MASSNLFEVINLSKNFNGNPALIDISLQISSGEIVGLVGENGAGKSTLLKIMMGVQPPSTGTMKLHGAQYAPKNPKEANENGLGMVFQEQSLIINLTVGQNMFLGQERPFTKAGLINYKTMYGKVNEILKLTNLTEVEPQNYVRDYKFATRQMIEISKVINQAYSSSNGHALILLDEPTSVLSENEIDKLFSEMQKLANAGHSLVFVSHRLEEVLKITDRIYVFKDAMKVAEFETSQANENLLYEAIVGKSSIEEYYCINLQKGHQNEIVFEAQKLGLFGTFKDVSFTLHRGEILGIYGVIGSGKEELCSVLCGDLLPSSGEIRINQKKAKYSNPSEALNKGIIMIPQERNYEGIIGILSVADNIAVSSYEHLGKYGFISLRKLKNQAEIWIKKLRIRTQSSKTSVNSLSGGNAQKVMFAKMLSSMSEIVILNHPTRGVDVGAKQEIYQIIRQMTEEGKSIILVGDTLDECIGLSNRMLVMKDGLVTNEFDCPPDNKPDKLKIMQYIM